MSDTKIIWRDKEVLKKVRWATDRVMKRGAQRIRNQARRNVGYADGLLKRSIKVFKSKYNDGYIVAAGGAVNKKAYYAPFVELGTPSEIYRPKSQRSGKRTPIKKKPFLRPAMKSQKAKIQRDFKNALDKA